MITFWVLWRERNGRIFDEAFVDLSKLLDVALSLFASWISHLLEFSGVRFSDWIFEWKSLMFG